MLTCKAISWLYLGRISAASRLYLGYISAVSRPHLECPWQHLRMSSDRTMDLAEKLYQAGYLAYPRLLSFITRLNYVFTMFSLCVYFITQEGYLSYPRTETDKFKEGTPLRELIEKQAAEI